MCNSYRIKPKRGVVKELHEKVSAAAANLECSLVRKSDFGVVVTADLSVKIMRWGFHRSFNSAVNNARSDKLAGGMWAEAYRYRRCMIPMTLFYEWGADGRRKQAYEFAEPNGEFLWVAGIWEEHPEFGRCYSMVTTSAPPLMAPIHDRMPAILLPSKAAGFLNGGPWDFQPFAGPLAVAPCASPLARPQAPEPQQTFKGFPPA
jgi:putative SOS response-associated peptidase YedK